MNVTYSSKYKEDSELPPIMEPESNVDGGGSSIVLTSSSSAPVLPMEESTEDIHKNIRFIKERLKALIQIASLDEATMKQGGWTQNDVREELLKLHSELSSERMRVHLYGEQNHIGGNGGNSKISPLSMSYQPFSSTTSSTTSATRDHLFSDEVAHKLQQLTAKLNRIVRANEKKERIRKYGKWSPPKRNGGVMGHLIPSSLQPSSSSNDMLKPLFRGDKSPGGLRRQRRRARASIGLLHHNLK
jgi:hypothetical protein|tara:strand:- start:59 stop:790 length:732 start_codon:yes stop_codon:yes gene_type:complete